MHLQNLSFSHYELTSGDQAIMSQINGLMTASVLHSSVIPVFYKQSTIMDKKPIIDWNIILETISKDLTSDDPTTRKYSS